jgi:NAD(P)-dependent dehydrogenase (short-subunit alcohol dehydrogenase family)
VEAETRERIVFVTGATSGIGKEAARQLAAGGSTVIIGARDRESGERAREGIAAATGSELELVVGDLAAMDGVHRVADELQRRFGRLNVLINNAGVDVGRRHTTEDGFELTFAVNYLAPFVLTTSLLDLLRASAPARVLNMASSGHRGGRLDFDDLQRERGFSGQGAYNDSKLALVLFTYELARGSGVAGGLIAEAASWARCSGGTNSIPHSRATVETRSKSGGSSGSVGLRGSSIGSPSVAKNRACWLPGETSVSTRIGPGPGLWSKCRTPGEMPRKSPGPRL